MKISARNVFAGTVSTVVRGAVSTEVTVHLANGIDIVSVITSHSARHLKLKKGKRAYALIKADSVIVGVD